MKVYSLDATPFEPVSHGAGLQKKVLIRGAVPPMKDFSRLLLAPGDAVFTHDHNATEVLYVVRGMFRCMVNGDSLSLKGGSALWWSRGSPTVSMTYRRRANCSILLCRRQVNNKGYL